MQKFLIESTHSASDCEMVIKETHAIGYLHHFEWGCTDDVHTGWAVLEAENRDQALMSVPSVVRGQSRAVRLVKFGPDQGRKMHS